MFGQVTIWISFFLSIILSVLFFIANFKEGRIRNFSSNFFYLLPVTLLFASAYLLYNILTHNYQFTYIWQYSNNHLPTHLLITTFFSGQEGSFLLWALLVAFFAIFVRGYARKYGYEHLVMAHFSLVLVFLTLMMVLKNPFEYIWQSFPNEGLDSSFAPADGRGLNPILENFWNMIHPPILFIGYSAMTVPFVFAISGLIKRDYKNWIKIATPWILFASGILGTGIMLGGFWAYETLGWGGFWGWDPVENASLLPWLVSVALVHTLYVQRKNEGLIKTNFVLAILSFVLVLFSTFLTRSGVLGDTSVHSFGEPGAAAYAVLLGGLLAFLGYSIFFLLIRMKEIATNLPKQEFDVSSREFALSLGSLTLLISSIIIFIGTTWPITTEIFSSSKSSVDISFYDKWNLPVALVMLILNGVAFYASWKKSDWKTILNKILLPFSLSFVLTIILAIIKIDRFDLQLLTFASLLSIYINVEIFIKILKNSFIKTGSVLSHIGVGVLLLGVVFSGGYDQIETLTLKLNQSVDMFGYKVKYIGRELVNPERKDQERYKYNVELQKDGNKIVVGSILYLSDFNDRQQIFLEPGIVPTFTKDLYISPVSFNVETNYSKVVLSKNTSMLLPGSKDISLTLTGFDMSNGETNSMGEILFGAVLDISTKDSNFTDTLYTWMNTRNFGGTPLWFNIPNTQYEISFGGLAGGMQQMGNTQATIYYRLLNETTEGETESFTFQIEIKPMMYLVWLGSFLIVFGFFLSIVKHNRKGNNNTQQHITKQ